MMTNRVSYGKPDAGKPHVRFDEGEVASATPRRGSLLYKRACWLAGLGFLAGCSWLAGCFKGKPVELTAANTVVVASAEMPKGATFAVEELTNYLAQVWGTSVAVSSNRVAGKHAIIVGDCAAARQAGIDVTKLPRDAFRIKVITDAAGACIFVAGRDAQDCDSAMYARDAHIWKLNRFEHATIFGVYDFLERFAGVRFYFPGALGTIVPAAQKVSVPVCDLTCAPDNLIRRFSCSGGGAGKWFEPETHKVPKGRSYGRMLNMLQLRHSTLPIPCCHGQTGFFKPERYLTTHPEYFALLKDRKTGLLRRDTNATEKMAFHFGQMCQSSDIWEEIYLDAKSYLKGESGRVRGIPSEAYWMNYWNGNVYEKYIDVMPNDGCAHCLCEKCRANSPHGDDRDWATEIVWGQTARLANRLKAEGFDCVLTQMAYPPYRRIPDFEIPDNVRVMVAERGPWSVRAPELLARDNDEIRRWAEKLKRPVWLWTYPCKWGPAELPNVPQMSPRAYATYFKSVKPWTFGAFAEGDSDYFIFNYLNYYVFSKVMWKTDTDVEALLDEHFRLMFGAAAPEMAAFYRELEDTWMDKVAGSAPATTLGPGTYKIPGIAKLWNEVYGPNVLAKWRGYFEKGAAKLAPTSKEAARLAFIRTHFLEVMENAGNAYREATSVTREQARRAAAKQPNLLPEGSFDSDKGWYGYGIRTWDTNTFVSPPASMRLDCTNRTAVFYCLSKRLKPNTRYRISLFVKQNEIQNGGVFTEFRDASATPSNPYIYPVGAERKPDSEAHDWQLRTGIVKTGPHPETAGKTLFGNYISAKGGTCWIDDVRVEEVDENAEK